MSFRIASFQLVASNGPPVACFLKSLTQVKLLISQPRNGRTRKDAFSIIGEAVDLAVESEQFVVSGWLAYCARARDIQADERDACEIRDTRKLGQVEGRRIADSD